MSHQPRQQQSDGPKTKLVGLLAEFEQPNELVHACDETRKAGYTKTDAYSPFPVHGIDPALGIPRTKLPFIVLAVGMSGAVFAVFLQWYANAASSSPIWPGYDYIIGGKPYWSLPANIPVVFEIIILSSAFATFFGMWILNKLPMFANPLFRIQKFKRVTSDRFFLMIEVEDEKFDRERTESQMREWGATSVEPVETDLTDQELPRWLKPVGICAICLALVPPVMILRARGMSNDLPRLHVNPDMDWQFKSKAQQVSPRLEGSEAPLFADGRVMRPPVPGTIAFGYLEEDTGYYRGYHEPTSDASFEGTQFTTTTRQEQAGQDDGGQDTSGQDTSGQDTSSQDDAAPQDTDDASPQGQDDDASESQTPTASEEDEPDWLTSFPEQVEINEETMERGRQRYNVYCSACHGYAGDGDGLISRRAMELQATGNAAWSQTRNLHDVEVEVQPVGRLFDTITNGRSTMGGYGRQISVEDRWAIVLYVRALQAAEVSTRDEVEESLRENIPAETDLSEE